MGKIKIELPPLTREEEERLNGPIGGCIRTKSGCFSVILVVILLSSAIYIL